MLVPEQVFCGLATRKAIVKRHGIDRVAQGTVERNDGRLAEELADLFHVTFGCRDKDDSIDLGALERLHGAASCVAVVNRVLVDVVAAVDAIPPTTLAAPEQAFQQEHVVGLAATTVGASEKSLRLLPNLGIDECRVPTRRPLPFRQTSPR